MGFLCPWGRAAFEVDGFSPYKTITFALMSFLISDPGSTLHSAVISP